MKTYQKAFSCFQAFTFLVLMISGFGSLATAGQLDGYCQEISEDHVELHVFDEGIERAEIIKLLKYPFSSTAVSNSPSFISSEPSFYADYCAFLFIRNIYFVSLSSLAP